LSLPLKCHSRNGLLLYSIIRGSLIVKEFLWIVAWIWVMLHYYDNKCIGTNHAHKLILICICTYSYRTDEMLVFTLTANQLFLWHEHPKNRPQASWIMTKYKSLLGFWNYNLYVMFASWPKTVLPYDQPLFNTISECNSSCM
jgi:hypothetical protein